MTGLAERARALAEQAAADARHRIAARLAEDAPDLTIIEEADTVVISGRGLHRRRFDDPALRWIGSLAR